MAILVGDIRRLALGGYLYPAHFLQMKGGGQTSRYENVVITP